MDRFENKLTRTHKVHYSRYIMSWIREGGNCKDRVGFLQWLDSLSIDKDEANDMWHQMSNGKLELEESVKKFLLDRKYMKELHEGGL